MVARCYSGAINGVDASTVEIEVSSAKSTSSFAIVGLPDQAVKEAKDRVSTALKNSGFRSKDEYAITVNLAPADVRKEGPIYDLPIAVALLRATKRLRNEELEEYAFAGELSLAGGVRRVRGIIPIVMEMRRIGRRAVFVPEENAEEASVVPGIDVIPVRTLAETVACLNGEVKIEPHATDLAGLVAAEEGHGDDFADIKGQKNLRRAIETAVAGGHNMLMIGAPGSGNEANARQILGEVGLFNGEKYEGFEPHFLSYAETTSNFKDRLIDGFMFTTGAPNSGIQEIVTAQPLRFIPVDGELRDKIIAKYPFFAPAVIEKGTYSGLTSDVQTIAVQACPVARRDMSDDEAYALTKAIFENLEALGNAHAKGKSLTLAHALDGMTLDIHPGALKYYKEVGLVK